MSCREARERFSDWADEALTPEERARFDAHLEDCADCRRELDRFGQTVSLLRQIERPRAPVGFVDRVLAATQPRPWYRRLRERLALPLPVKLPVEAVAVVLVATLAVYVFQRTPELQQATRPEPAPSVSSESAGSRDAEPRAYRLEDRPREVKPGPGAPRVAPEPPRRHSPELLQGRRAEQREPVDPKGKAPETRLVTPPAPATGALEATSSSGAQEAAGKASAPPRALPAPSSALTPKKEAPVERLAAPREGRADSAEERDRSLAAPRPPARSAMRAPPPGDVVGRLGVKDREAAERELAELLTRLGGIQTGRRAEAEAAVVELVVPQSSYAEFTRSLARIGSWLPEAEPSELPARVRIMLRISE